MKAATVWIDVETLTAARRLAEAAARRLKAIERDPDDARDENKGRRSSAVAHLRLALERLEGGQ